MWRTVRDSHPGTGGWRSAPELHTHTPHTHARTPHTRTHHPRPCARRQPLGSACRSASAAPLLPPGTSAAAHARACRHRRPRRPNHPRSDATGAPAAGTAESHGPHGRSPALPAPIGPMPPQLEPIAAREGRGWPRRSLKQPARAPPRRVGSCQRRARARSR